MALRLGYYKRHSCRKFQRHMWKFCREIALDTSMCMFFLHPSWIIITQNLEVVPAIWSCRSLSWNEPDITIALFTTTTTSPHVGCYTSSQGSTVLLVHTRLYLHSTAIWCDVVPNCKQNGHQTVSKMGRWSVISTKIYGTQQPVGNINWQPVSLTTAVPYSQGVLRWIAVIQMLPWIASQTFLFSKPAFPGFFLSRLPYRGSLFSLFGVLLKGLEPWSTSNTQQFCERG